MNPLVIADIIKQVNDLPSLSTVVIELLSSIDQEDIDIDSLAVKVSQDQALTAKTLRLANSSFYGMQRKVTTIQEAIAVLGFRNVRSLITTAALAGSFTATNSGGFDFRAFWRHSIATAVCAKTLARQLNMNQDYAYTAGLLHDIGRLVLVTRFAKNYEETLAYRAREDCYLMEAERAILGIDHAMAGQALASHWKFPVAMQLAVAHHHAPEEPECGALAALIHIADAIAHALDFSQDENALAPQVSSLAWNSLNLDQVAFMEVFRKAEHDFEGACQVLAA